MLLIVGLATRQYWQDAQQERRQQVAHLLSRCVNAGLLSLFNLQANNWQRRPAFYRAESARLLRDTTALPSKALRGRHFPEWREAVRLCERLTLNSNTQHTTIFAPLGDFAAADLRAAHLLGSPQALSNAKHITERLYTAAEAADNYLLHLRADIRDKIATSSLSPGTQQLVESTINTEALDNYRSGNFSTTQVRAQIRRVQAYLQLLTDNPRGYTIRNGGLYFHDSQLQLRVDRLNKAIIQGQGPFMANWTQIVQYQQMAVNF
ncbi:hypothetical protein [Microbulbifer discodermiae]|uniref:hypothetical protein n=1 Tax=Microbulbifer sp. 2201CG32-9 TaxID=3232309 RepID=UPI00345BD6CD